MRTVQLFPPSIQGQAALFRWQVDPSSELYHQETFVLRFPGSVDLARVPERLWWDVLLACLHAHWLLLRPCAVHIPIRLGAAERLFWLQLLKNGADTIDTYGTQRASSSLGIEIVDSGPAVPRAPVSGNRYATAFSGGKDSLLQAGLLAELTEKPLLVTTTSPMPPLADHETARRRQVLEAIQVRRDVEFVEVHSDFRAAWDNSFASKLGYPVAVNELTDTFLYTAALAVTGAALEATRLFVASETELQETIVVDRKIVQHSHFMYSAATQRALARLFACYGFSLGSLTWPLHSMQVQALLWARYPDLCDLQYSCWRVGPDEMSCSRCSQCLRIAMTALAAGHNPQRMGIDLQQIIDFASRWDPDDRARSTPILPAQAITLKYHALVLAAIRRTSVLRLAYLLAGGDIRSLFSGPTRTALKQFRTVRKRARKAAPPPRLGVREAFCDWLEPGLRDRLTAIYHQHFAREPRSRHLAIHRRSDMLAARASAFLE